MPEEIIKQIQSYYETSTEKLILNNKINCSIEDKDLNMKSSVMISQDQADLEQAYLLNFCPIIFSVLNPEIILQIVSLALMENSIIFVSKNLNVLTSSM